MLIRSLLLGAACCAALVLPAFAADWPAVGAALGKTGTVQGDVYRVGLPRSDLKVTLDGIAIKPSLALGSWVAFHDMGGRTMVMGDLVLTHEEVNPVMSVLIDNGLSITALHNHLLRSSPATMYMHIDGQGDAVKLATAIHAALAKSATPMGPAPAAAAPAPLDMDVAAVERGIGGYKGAPNGGVLQFSIPRAEEPKAGGM
ncbi:MAG: peptidase, partial [Caulobacteraceae bacterium]|nr:peptidase [Caulobacteraceae bacterium]